MESSLIQRAVRAFDLILRAGNFGVVALDVADVPMHIVRTLPWTTWMRLAHANEGTKTVALLVGEGRMGKSARGTSLIVSAPRAWHGSARKPALQRIRSATPRSPERSEGAERDEARGWGPAH